MLCIGAGGIISQIAPTLVRKGVGRIAGLNNVILNRQRFYEQDLGKNKAFALAETEIRGLPFRL